MKKYWTIFTIEWIRLLELRLDFWIGRLISVVVFLTNYFLWTTVFAARQDAFGYSLEKMVTYVLGIAFLYNIVFVHTHERMGWEIVEGVFNTYLVRPVSYFFYAVATSTAKRVLYLFSITLTLALFLPFLHVPFVQYDIRFVLLFLVALFLGILLYIFIDFLLGISSFWFYRSFGPRWMMLMLVVMASGAAFPIDLLPSWLAKGLMATPLPYLVFFPLNVYLGRPSFSAMGYGFSIAALWVVVLFFFTRFAYRRGLRRYEGSGI